MWNNKSSILSPLLSINLVTLSAFLPAGQSGHCATAVGRLEEVPVNHRTADQGIEAAFPGDGSGLQEDAADCRRRGRQC